MSSHRRRLLFLSTLGATAAAWVLLACGEDRPIADDAFVSQDGSAPVGRSDASASTRTDAAGLDAEAGQDADAATPDAAREAGPERDAGDAGAISYEDPPICPTTITLGVPEVAGFSTAGTDLGLSVTLDGLSASWTTEAAGIVTVHVVDRTMPTKAFGSEQTISGSYATGRIALTQSGLGLAIVNADGLGLTYFARAARNKNFGPPAVGPFTALATFATDELAPAGDRFANPLFARDDAFLFFTRVTAAGWITYVATRFGTEAPFTGGAPYVEGSLGVAGARRILTGASRDLRTLFVWDDIAARTHVVQLTAASAPLSDVLLGDARDLQPTGDCTAFWYTAAGDVVRAPRP